MAQAALGGQESCLLNVRRIEVNVHPPVFQADCNEPNYVHPNLYVEAPPLSTSGGDYHFEIGPLKSDQVKIRLLRRA